MNYQYFGLFLNEHNRNELMKIIFANPIIANLVLQRGSTLYLDHCSTEIKTTKRYMTLL